MVGLIESFRRGGEFGDLNPMMLQPVYEEQDDGVATSYYVLKIAPNTPAEFEESMTETLQAGASEWTFSVK